MARTPANSTRSRLEELVDTDSVDDSKTDSGKDSGLNVGDLDAGPVSQWAQVPGLTKSQFFLEYIERLTNGRDMHAYITAASETGVGKTTLAFALALLMDQQGWHIGKATLDPREYGVLYDEVGPGSVLLLDEAEQAADNRRGMSKENVELSHDFATKRYRQVFGLMTLPTKSWLDDRIADDAADYWIQAMEGEDGKPKGEARVYRLRNDEHYERNYTKRVEVISWPVLDDHPEFRKLEQKKADRMEGRTESRYVHRDEVEEIKENYWNKASKKTRYHIVRAMYASGLTQTEISDILTEAKEVEGISQQHVSRQVNADSFEDVYSQ